MAINQAKTKITKPVSIEDVRQVLVEGSHDLATLCKSNKIKKWCRYKPTIGGSIFATDTDEHWKTKGVSYNGLRYFCGLKVGGLTTVWSGEDAKSVYRAGYNYEYPTPQGGSGSPYRLVDFAGYDTDTDEPMCVSDNMPFGKTSKIIVSGTSAETGAVRFSVIGTTKSGAIHISDMVDCTCLSGQHLVLCANVYEKNGYFIAAYINNSIKMNVATSTSTLDSSYNQEYSLSVDVNFDKATYWGQNIRNLVVVLTLDVVQYESGSQKWVTQHKMEIPYDNNHYHTTEIEISEYARVFKPQEYQDGTTGSTPQWVSIYTPIANASNFLEPNVHFQVTKAMGSANVITFHNGVCFLRTKYTMANGSIKVTDGVLSSATNSNIPTDVLVPEAVDAYDIDNNPVDVYFRFANAFGTNDATIFISNHSYTLELYFVNNGAETRVGQIDIIKG